MSAPTQYEFPSAYGTINSANMSAGEFLDAGVLRQAALNSNRLAGKAHMIANYIWSATVANNIASPPSYTSAKNSGDLVVPGGLCGVWFPVIRPGSPIVKKQSIRSYTVRGFAAIVHGSDQYYLGIETRAATLPDAPGSASSHTANVIPLSTSTGLQAFSATGISASATTADELSIYVCSPMAFSAATGGGTQTGTATVLSNSTLEDLGATFTTIAGSTWADLGAQVQFRQHGTATILAGPFPIVKVIDGQHLQFRVDSPHAGTNGLFFNAPSFVPYTITLDYDIVLSAAGLRIVNIAIWGEDNTGAF